MTDQIRPAVVALALMTLLTGILYPLATTGIAQLLFPVQANGSLIETADGRLVGSALIGQEFSSPGYFWARPSATSPVPYAAEASSGSNLAPTSAALHDGVRARVAALRALDPDNREPVPVDLVTASGSGLDPHISPAAARYQAARVARSRGLSAEQVARLIDRYTAGRTLGVLGEPTVNVLLLNLALDSVAPAAAARAPAAARPPS
jgi:K+-transporting ATPase ATPase C chain